MALRAEIVVVSPNSERVINADDFFVDLLTTALNQGELIREIRVPKSTGKTGQAYLKVYHPASGFAVVGVAVTITLDTAGVCINAGVGITGVSTKAYRAAGVESELIGKTIDETTARAAAMKAADRVDINSDLYASEGYRTNLAQVYTRRAILAAVERAYA
jgi:carbon-monoxide dehydrogenase medium subunit